MSTNTGKNTCNCHPLINLEILYIFASANKSTPCFANYKKISGANSDSSNYPHYKHIIYISAH
ncbi:protein of unknown function [Maridesulfovibrio hydrothermalis AM13 = DSM 14728]|uniref:Uncharacterized protein n=1 Tax=Maridesulfovibrio hydrothermalis AM13 = DSM 14728 TaxID=1121451 RepID=L0RF62_9BACT|nr:protein of unknown function [Maridesulfovibrio hydrothermalis AM13 = DSM 14728]